jgi:glycosyltransferase involved in cell wall biosynthesis
VDNDFFEAIATPYREGPDRAAGRAGLNLANDAFVVLFAGKLEEKKRTWQAIEAVARLGAGAVLIVAGSGEMEERCRKAAADSQADVRFVGFRNQTEIAKLYGLADCLVLPSDSGETWGLVVNEALASGLPCVVSERVGCAPDLVENGVTGYVSRFGDADSIADCLSRVRRDLAGATHFGAACRARAARYSIAGATSGLIAALDSATRH